MTSNNTVSLTPSVQPWELNLPKLSLVEGNMLWSVLNNGVSRQNLRDLEVGEEVVAPLGVFLYCLYPKQTGSEPRVEGKDYLGFPGIDPRAQFGPLCRVFRRKADNLVRFTIWSYTRQDYCTIIPDGLEGFNFMPLPENIRPPKGD